MAIMRIVVAGSSGLLGRALVSQLSAHGHDVLRLVRRAPTRSDETRWDPQGGHLDPQALAGAEAVVNLCGAPLGGPRWTAARREEILSSRVESTRTLVTALGALPPSDRPGTLLNASATGAYGSRGEEVLTEASETRTDAFLGQVVARWEEAARTVPEGVRCVMVRSGIVLAPEGGALAPLLRLIRLGVGGRLGDGRQWWPWITRADHVNAMEFLLTHDSVAGPVNLVAPAPSSNAELIAALGRALGRPTAFAVPAPALRLVLGNAADELLLASQRVRPATLLAAGFEFEHPTLPDAVSWLVSVL